MIKIYKATDFSAWKYLFVKMLKFPDFSLIYPEIPCPWEPWFQLH